MSKNETSYEELLEKYARLLDNPEEQSGINNRIWKQDCILLVFWMLLILLYSIVFGKM